MLRTKIRHKKKLNGQYIDINSRSSFYDLNVYRIISYIYSKDIRRLSTIKKTYELKKTELMRTKYKLNLKKKSYVDSLRALKKEILQESPISLYNDSVNISGSEKENIKAELEKYKIIKKGESIGYFAICRLYERIRHKDIFIKLKNITADIKHIEGVIKNFDEWYNNISGQKKLNSYDIKQLKKGIYTENVKAVIYFYLQKLKKSPRRGTYNRNLRDKLYLGVVSDDDIQRLIDFNHKVTFKNKIKELPTIDKELQNRIINKYI